MGVISEKYIMRRVNEFLQTDAGRERVTSVRKDLVGKKIGGGSGILSMEKIKEITYDIRDRLKSVVREVIASFRIEAIRAQIGTFDEEGRIHASISIDNDALRRASLHRLNRDFSIGRGEGVKDILALFTHGYSLKRRPYGIWVRSNGASMTRIGALMHRDPNPFLTDFVNELNAEYADQCVVTLNDKYTTQGGG